MSPSANYQYILPDYNSRVFGMFGGQQKYEESIERLIEFAQIEPDSKVLELCCGTGIATKYIMRYSSNILGVELNPKLVTQARTHLPSYISILTQNGLNSGIKHKNKYDLILCVNGFHYFNPAEFYDLTSGLLAPEGKVVFNVKLGEYERNKPIHYQAYTAYFDALKELFTNYGLHLPSISGLSDRGFINSKFTEESFGDIIGDLYLNRKQINKVLIDNPEAKENYIGYWVQMIQELSLGFGFRPTKDNLYSVIKKHLSPLLEQEEVLAKAELFLEARSLRRAES